MISDASGKANPNEVEKLLDLELAQKRVEWKRASARHRTFRSLSFVFLFLLIVGALFAFFFVFSRVNEEKANQHSNAVSSVPR
jgi:hypothetical protein